MAGLAMVLVTQDRDGTIQAVLQAVPPGNVLSGAVAAGVSLPVALFGAAKIAKIQALAVAEQARGQGLGEALLRKALRIYWQLDYFMVYGQFPATSGLETYYTRQGFTVLPAGQHIDLSRASLPVAISHNPGERLFVRWQSTMQ